MVKINESGDTQSEANEFESKNRGAEPEGRELVGKIVVLA